MGAMVQVVIVVRSSFAGWCLEEWKVPRANGLGGCTISSGGGVDGLVRLAMMAWRNCILQCHVCQSYLSELSGRCIQATARPRPLFLARDTSLLRCQTRSCIPESFVLPWARDQLGCVPLMEMTRTVSTSIPSNAPLALGEQPAAFTAQSTVRRSARCLYSMVTLLTPCTCTSSIP